MIIAGTGTFILVWMAGLATASPRYSWHHSMISDLGSHACVVREGYRMCSGHATSFNAGLVAAGTMVAVAAMRLARLWGRMFTFGTASLGSGLLLLGLVPSDVSHPVHMAGAVLTLPVTASAVFVSALPALRALPPAADVAERVQRRALRVRGILGLTALTACLDHLLGDQHALIPRGIAEAVSVVALVLALLMDAVRVLTRRSD